MQRRVLCYLLMGVVSPAILFTFIIFFGPDSYQVWGDRYHYNLTNKYLFAQFPGDTMPGPLWREDTLGGNIWLASLATSPLAVDVLAGRFFRLSPLGIDLVGILMLYFVAVVAMYLYLRRALSLSIEAATAGAVIFAATTYWVCYLAGTPDLPMGVAWLPALLVVAHQVDALAESGRGGRVIVPLIGLAVLFYGCAIHTTLASLPATVLLVVTYACAVFALRRSVLLIVFALGVGLVLYSPFLWSFVEAAGISHRNAGTGFYQQTSFDPHQLLSQGLWMLSQAALGHNRYGIYLVVVVGVLVWLCIGQRWGQEPVGLRRIVLFAAGATVAIYAIEFFHEPINEAKRNIPFLGGWDVTRFSVFSFFGLATLVAWMYDRSLFRPEGEALPPRRRTALRMGLITAGVLGGMQIAYSAYRIQEVPAVLSPQGLILAIYLFLFAVVTIAFLVFLYQGTRLSASTFGVSRTSSGRLWFVACIVLSVSLITTVQVYRGGLVSYQGIGTRGHAAPILSYAQRYMVPEDIQAITRLTKPDGRVVDLTRPLNEATWSAASEITVLPLAGLRTPAGYSNLYPAWYGRFVQAGINGNTGALWNIVQVEDTGHTNFEILPLLDVEYVLTRRGMVLPGYRPVVELESSRKTLSQVEAGSRLGPAFVSPGLRCFPTDGDALQYIHESDLGRLKAHAVLVPQDAGAVSLCARQDAMDASAQGPPSRVHALRGPDRVSLEVESGPGGILTLSDTYFPGWKVFVNGVEKPLLRTYTALRGVVIEPGPQSVVFAYAPYVFTRLFWLSNLLLGLLLLLAVGVWMRERTIAKTSGEPRRVESLTGTGSF